MEYHWFCCSSVDCLLAYLLTCLLVVVVVLCVCRGREHLMKRERKGVTIGDGAMHDWCQQKLNGSDSKLHLEVGKVQHSDTHSYTV